MLQQTKDAKEAWEESEEQDEAEHDTEDDLDAIDKRLAQEEEEVWRMRNYGNVSLKYCSLARSRSMALSPPPSSPFSLCVTYTPTCAVFIQDEEL